MSDSERRWETSRRHEIEKCAEFVPVLDTLGGTVLLAGFHRSHMIIKAENASLPPYSGCGSSL
jgi:hypothetical protein